MLDWLNLWLFGDWWQSLQQYSWWLMFASAFLSATVLPGNSEVVFVGLATPLIWAKGWFSFELQSLLLAATFGNTLGSLTTYWLGRWLPNNQNQAHPRYAWALAKLQRHGSWFLLLSWLPIIGDILCAVAGWLRLDAYRCALFIFIGKFARYALLALFGAALL